MDEKTLLECFRDPESTATDEERALRLLSRYSRPKQAREIDIKNQGIDWLSDRYPSLLLHYACRNSWYDVSRELVDKYQCDPHLVTKWKYTPLHFACKGGSIDIVRFLIDVHHCDPACRGSKGRTPLLIACESEKLDIVEFLLEECNCDPGVQDDNGDTPLHWACEGGSMDIVRFLIIDHHCDPTCRGERGRTPLHWACVRGKLDIVEFLLKEGKCDPRVQDERGDTPLHCACEGGSLDIATFLVGECHCDPRAPDEHGETPLHYACKGGSIDIVKFLVDQCHCDPKLKDRNSNTPLHFACCEEGNIDVVKFLIVDHHCDPACRGSKGRTPLLIACESEKLDIVKFLVEECHCDPRVKDRNGDTLLHCASKGGSIDIVRFLITDHHCDPTSHGRWGRTPLSIACMSRKLDMVKLLVNECHCDPKLVDRNGNTPLHFACCKEGSIDIVRFLVVEHHCDLICHGRDRTPLSIACESGKLEIVKFLVEECHCDTLRKDEDGDTPLHLATLKEHDDVLLFLLSHTPPLKLVNSIIELCKPSPKLLQLLKAFITCRTEYPLESAFKIFALGNPSAGKSTLVKVIENQITSFFGSIGGQWRNISESAVVPLTAGIIPVSIKSRRLGQIVIYDMAGQYQYYSSHAALLRSLVSSFSTMFLVVVNLKPGKEEITRELQYWNSFFDNCCCSAGRPPTVVVFSHADEVTDDKPERKSLEIMEGLTHSQSSSSFSEAVTLDCRKLASDGLSKISKIVARCCANFRQTFRFNFAVQLLYAFIRSRLADQIACTVSELQSLIKQEQDKDLFALKIKDREVLPTDATELSQHLTTLSDKGQLLFLKSARKVEDSWVVVDKAVLLSEINGTVFAPNNFQQHHNIANSTGVVPFSKIKKVFPNRDPYMVVAFLQHLEFCQEISETEVSLISKQHFRCSNDPVERFFFFPNLVSEERPSGVSEAIDTPSYRCGWTLQCSRPHQFLTTQFLHVLLLRLAFSSALAPDNTHEVQLFLERRCCVWKNGICWLSRKGVETTVVVIEQNTAIFLTISCLTGREMECVQHRSQVIKCILEAKEELCPAVTMKEFLIHPSCTTNRITDNSLQSYSLCELMQVVLENQSVLVSQPGQKMVKIDQLLYFEPYTCFDAEILRELFENHSDKLVSEAFLDVVSKTAHTKVDQLKQALCINNTKLRAAIASAPPFQRDQPEYQCKLVFQVWKESTQSPTYGALRSVLDKYSVFCGRNPLVSCE